MGRWEQRETIDSARTVGEGRGGRREEERGGEGEGLIELLRYMKYTYVYICISHVTMGNVGYHCGSSIPHIYIPQFELAVRHLGINHYCSLITHEQSFQLSILFHIAS